MARPGTDLDATLPQSGSSPESVAVATTLEATTAFTLSGQVVRTGVPDLDRPLQVGDVIGGRYEIRRELGHGGCGYVYAVFDRELEVEVALKTLRPDLRLEPEAIAQLKREIQLARRVTHRNICRIFDVGFHDDDGRSVPFLTMEMVNGPSLADRLLDTPKLAPDELETLTRQLIAGLAAAHAAGVVHADLKPGNIMLDESGDDMRVVITDFGLATAQAIDLNPDGYILGTPAYMAPEQVEGATLSPATDYYALGCTLYHAATGDVPFRENGLYATAYARLEKQPPPPDERADVADVWSGIIMGLLAREPDARIDGQRIVEILGPRRRRAGLIASVAIAGAVIVAAALAWGGRSSSAGPLELSMPDDPLAAALLVKAEAKAATGSPTAAVALLDEARERSPESPRIHAAAGEAYQALDPRRAVEEQRRAVELAGRLDADEQHYYQALLYRAQGKLGEAITTLTELDLRRPNSFVVEYHLAEVQAVSGYVDLARETLANIEPPDSDAEIRVLWAKLELDVRARDYAAALELARELRARARQAGSVGHEAWAEVRAARCLRQLGKIEDSETSAARSLALATQVDEPYLIAAASAALAAVFMSRHQFREVLEQLEHRETALARMGHKRELLKLAVTRAEVFAETGQVDRALALLDDEIIPVLRREEIVYWEGYSLLIRAEAHRMRGEPARGLDDCRAGHAIFRSLGNQRLTAFAHSVCASIQVVTGELDEAAAAIDQAEAIRTKLELEVLVAQNRMDRGEIALARGDAETAVAVALTATRFFDERPVVNDQATALELLARARWRAGDHAGARSAIAEARERVEGDSARLEHVIALTERVIAGDDDASADLAGQIIELERHGYRTLALEARAARAVVERQLGRAKVADELERAARAEARRRGLRPYRYQILAP